LDATKDYYRVLGVPQDASRADIKSAFRKLAKKYHPDRNPDNAKAAQRFRQINEAYTILEDEKDRSRYDRLRRLGVGLDFSGEGAIDLNDLKDMVAERVSGLGDFFSGFMGSSKSQVSEGPSDKHGAKKGRDLTYRVAISIEKSIQGGKATFTIPGLEGGPPRKVRVDLPSGLKSSQKIRLDGQGKPAKGGGPPGDLFLKIRVKDSDDFRLEDDKVLHPVLLNLRQLIKGATIEVPTPGGETGHLKIPPGTQPGTKFRLKGQAGPDRDLFVEVQVAIPTNLSKDAQARFEAFCEAAEIAS
jgi:DnaJ-class molecular chaperone